jgi:GNAT superfamily N-acetyltransferase
LVNAHVAAVVPGVSVSVSGLLSQLEREPGEFIVDPWVTERVTLVAEQRHRVVAAAHLLRYSSDPEVAESYRGAGEIRWLLHWPQAPYSPDPVPAADALARACLAELQSWRATRCYADGALPAPGVHGVPEQWPHIRDLYRRNGFRELPGNGRSETVLLARVQDLSRPAKPLSGSLVWRRTLGINGTRIAAVLDHEVIGYIEVGSLDESPRTIGTRGWADIGNLEVTLTAPDGPVIGAADEPVIAGWLLAQAADWLELGDFTRLLAYTDTHQDPDEHRIDSEEFFLANGFQILTRTVRGLRLP